MTIKVVIFTRFLKRFIFALLLPISSLAAIYDPILEQTKPGTITIIGESHKKPESVELFQNLALDVIRHYQCVVIGLEIGSDQQTILDTVMQGKVGHPLMKYHCGLRLITHLYRFTKGEACPRSAGEVGR